IQVREQVREALGGAQRDREVTAFAPLRIRLVEWMLHGRDLVAERLEERTQESLAAPARQHRDPRLQGDRLLCELRPVLAAPAERRAEHASDGDTQERRCYVGPIVHVLLERAAFPGRPLPPTHEVYWVHFQHQRGCAALCGRLWVEDVSL